MGRFRSLSGDRGDKSQDQRKVIHRGKAKTLYQGPQNHTLIQHFRDTITARNGEKTSEIKDKGIVNNLISALLLKQLGHVGIPTHLIQRLTPREQLIHRTEVIPVEVVVRNRAAGSLCRRLGISHGETLRRPMIEFFYKDDSLGDPLVSEENILAMGWMTPAEMEEVAAMAYRVNDFVAGYFAAVSIVLVDMKLEFGRSILGSDGDCAALMVVDEISPDTTRLWDCATSRVLDKDIFRQDLGDVCEGYGEVARRLGVVSGTTPHRQGGADVIPFTVSNE